MEKVQDILDILFTRDLATSPVETAIFLTVVFGFFLFLIVASIVRKKTEQRRTANFLRNKWDSLCRIYNLNEQERTFLEDVAAYLDNSDKKYLLLANYQAFHDALQAYSYENKIDKELLESITTKTKMGQTERLITELPLQRRKDKRRAVQITAFVAPIEHTTAHLPTRMYDISRGGCRLDNPDKRFMTGDDIKVTFTLKDKKFKDIPAEVVRTSSFGKVLHVAFGHVATAQMHSGQQTDTPGAPAGDADTSS